MGLDVRTRWEDMCDPEPQNSLRPGKPLSGKRTGGVSQHPHLGHRKSGGSGKKQFRVSSREGSDPPGVKARTLREN